jgi:hypothetical protein
VLTSATTVKWCTSREATIALRSGLPSSMAAFS